MSVALGLFSFSMIAVFVAVLAFYMMTEKKEKGTKEKPLENDDPEARVFVASSGSPSADANTNAPVVQPRDCSGTEYIKKGQCMRDGKVLDGTKGACGDGKVEWILDPSHENFKFPIAGGKACESQFRDCNVPCPKPCEGNTWKKGSCVRTEADGSETILDGTAGKCGDGTVRSTLDQNADDFKPAVGGGACTFTKSGACHIKCPKPEPPKCSYPVLGWQDNTALGCVVSRNDHRVLGCGKTGEIQQYKASTLNTEKCGQLTRWVACTTNPCPVDCEGSWGDYGPCIGECDSQPQKKRTYTVTKTAKHGGKACPYNDGEVQYKQCGRIVGCCKPFGDWKMKGSCGTNGRGAYYKDYTGECKTSVVNKDDDCCYQGYDWKNFGKCSIEGKQLQKQTTKNCPAGTDTRTENCCYQKGDWKNSGKCSNEGKQLQKQTTKNCPAGTDTRSVDCCYQAGDWKNSGKCSNEGKQLQKQTTKNCPAGTDTRSVGCCYQKGDWKNNGMCSGKVPKIRQKQTVRNCPAGTNTRYVDCCVWNECKDWARDGDPCYYNRRGSLSRMYWNNGMSSYELKGGCKNWEMRAYDHPDFKGEYFVMERGGRKNVPSGWNDRVGSVKAVLK